MSFVVYSPTAPQSSQFPTFGQVCLFLLVGSVFLFYPYGFSWVGEDAVKLHFRRIIKLRVARLWQPQAGGVLLAAVAVPLPRAFQEFCHCLLGLQQRGTAQGHLLQNWCLSFFCERCSNVMEE